MKNAATIENNASDPECRALRRLALELFDVAVRAVDPATLVRRAVRPLVGGATGAPGNLWRVGGATVDLDLHDHVWVLGAGKAGASMAAALEGALGERISGGAVVVPGRGDLPKLKRVRLLRGGHPLPTREGVEAAARVLALAKRASKNSTSAEKVGVPRDLVICLISGGGSALMTLPAPGLTLEDLRATNDALIKSGAPIEEVNAVRKHLSAIKGGRLAEAAHPARVVALVVSDVVGDPLDVVASGPTVPDPTTFQEALDVVRRRGLAGSLPVAVLERLQRGVAGLEPETPKPGDPSLAGVKTFVVGSAKTATEAVVGECRKRNVDAEVFSRAISGEAREFAPALFLKVRERLESAGDGPLVLVGSGELTVVVVGGGVGGRNQEMLLALAPMLSSVRPHHACVLAAGLDGLEGNSPAAGAVVDEWTLSRAEGAGLDVDAHLEGNDSHRFFRALDDAVVTGPTGTNVNDLVVVCLKRSRPDQADSRVLGDHD
ncbi:MAG: glycerate kinase [Promethearchaeota archaeon]